MLQDSYGRKIEYLRVSVTDRCDLRCVYCMPPEGIAKQSHHLMMRFEEIVEVVRAAAELGITQIRLTGGEPLVRSDLPQLVRMIAAISGIEDISLTTNAMLLEKKAQELSDAGLNRVNISLDTLKPDKFKRITRLGDLEKLWRGIEAAEKYNLAPIKINAVVMRGVNDDELLDLAGLSLTHSWHIRFIELMPVNNQVVSWGEGFPPPDQMYISVQEMMAILKPFNLEPVETKVGRGPAREFHSPGAPGQVGFISPLGDHFCKTCNRLRLTADGCLRPCLLHPIEIPLLEALRAGKSVVPYILRAVEKKPMEHELLQSHCPKDRYMMEIGG